MSRAVPDTLAGLLTGPVLGEVQDALSVPSAERPRRTLEIEIESDDEGTFCLTYDDGALSGAKGFADEPAFSVRVPSGGYALIKEHLDAALRGFADAPGLAAKQAALKGLRRAELEAALDAVCALDDAGVEIDVEGVGVFAASTGPLDAVTRTLKARAPRDLLDRARAGEPVEKLAAAVRFSGDKRLLQDLLAALGGVWLKLKSA